MSGNEHFRDEDELSTEERALFAALPREREPGRLLEERTVRALRARGLVEAPAVTGRRAIPRAWWAAGVAASLALFTGGVSVGQWVGAARAEAALEAERARNAAQASHLVAQTGQAYVTALAAFARMADTASAGQAAQGREAAKEMLRAAASEVVRIAPDDPVATGILAGFDRARAGARAPADTGSTRKLVWF